MMPRYRWLLLGGLLLLFSAMPAYAWQQTSTTLVLVPYRTTLEEVRAQSLPLTPLALVPVDGELWVVTLAAQPAMGGLKITGEYMDLGEFDSATGSLWLVDFTDEVTLGEPLPDLGMSGQVLWQHAPHVLLVATAETAAGLSEQGLRLMALDAPITLGERSALLPPAPTAPEPIIAGQIAQLDAAAVEGWDRRLSGEEAVVIGGASRYLRSRYSSSTNGRRSEQYVFERLQGMGYTPSYFVYTTPYGSSQWRNIVIDLPGQVDPSRKVLLTAHLDSISHDGNQAASLAPGADDNGSGSAALLAIADLMRGQANAYTLRLVWFTGEEFGYWGSKPYTQWLANRNENVVAAINIDMFGYDGNGDQVVEVHTGVQEKDKRLGDYLAAANALYGLNLTLERKTTTAAFFSDHRSFWNQGYTSLMVIENFFDDTAEYGRPPDRNPNYHKTTDRMRSVDVNYTTAISRMAMAAALHLIQPMAATPTFTPTSSATLPAGGCEERVLNGGFETDAGWRFGATPATAGYAAAAARSGLAGLRTGIVSPSPNKRAFSSATQLLSLPAANSITLDLWLRTAGADANDYGEVLVLNSGYGVLGRLWRGRPAGTGWNQLTFDLTPYRGREVVLYLNTYNDGAGSATWTYFDDISVRACDSAGATVTPSPTATPSPAATPTRTPTPATPTATPSPAATVTPTSTSLPPTATPTPEPGACVVNGGTELMVNGGFEGSNGWLLPVTASRAAYSSAAAHSGARSLRLGLLPAAGLALDAAAVGPPHVESNLLGETAPSGATYSTAHQTVSLPAGAASLVLTYWRLPGTTAAAGDWQRLLLLKPGSYAVLTTLWRGLQSADTWQATTVDLTPYRSQTVVLYFEVYNNSTTAADRSWLFVDDVSLIACSSPAGIDPAANTGLNPLFFPMVRRSPR